MANIRVETAPITTSTAQPAVRTWRTRAGTAITFLAGAAIVACIPIAAQPPAPTSTEAQQGRASAAGVPKFEVASIKPASADDVGRMIMIKPTGLELKGVPIQTLLQFAFGVEPDHIVGAPKWVESNRYSIEAKVSADDAPKMQKLSMEQKRSMLLPLLQERFGLKYHHETRQLPVYALVVAKGGPKLTKTKSGELPDLHTAPPPPGAASGEARGPNLEGPPRGEGRAAVGEGMTLRPGGIQSRGGTPAFLAHALSNILGRTVVDKTGLTGNYDFSLNWTPDESMRGPLGEPGYAPSADPTGPTLFTAIQEQLGLKLESQTEPVDVVVIDHIDPPTQD